MTFAPYASINLAALKHNVAQVRDFAPKAKIMAVIKANAYGHGMLRIAGALNDVDAVAVARAAEGVQLRLSGFNKRIAVLEGFVAKNELDDFAQYNLDVVVHSIGQLDVLEKYQAKKKLSVWLKLDTGMSRLGVSDAEFVPIYQRLLSCSSIKQPVFFMTHLSSADELDSAITLQQLKRFNEKLKTYAEERSVANSAGIMGWPESISDWIRPGLMLYGVSPFFDSTGEMHSLKPVMTLHSRLIAVKNIAAGVAVGYGCTWVSSVETKIGVVAIGYGDGYPRYAKTGTPVLVNGKKVPLVGRVSMDTITVDLNSQINAKAGDPVTLWGDGLAVEEIARYADTIPYTLLCGITQRVEKR